MNDTETTDPVVSESSTPAPADIQPSAPDPGIGSGITDAPSDPSPAFDFASEDSYQQFIATLPDDLKDKNVFKETKTLAALAKQTVDSQSALGKKRLATPQDDWTDADWSDFKTQLRPETVDGYKPIGKHSVQLEGQDIQEVELAEDIQNQIRDVAFDIGLTPKQHQELEAKWAERQVVSEGALKAQMDDAIKAQGNALRQEWGEDFALNTQQANEAYEALSESVPELKELMDWSPFVANHPATMKLFHRLAPLIQDNGMSAEGSGSSFGQDTVVGIKAQIESFETDNYDILFASEDSVRTMTPADKAKRASLLEQRTKMFQKLYGNK